MLLSSFGLNIGASALFEHLRKLSDKGPCGPTLEDALTAVQASSEQEQHALQQVADRVDVMPMLFGEALQQQRHELVADLGGLLASWGSTLPFAKIEAMLDRIGEETSGISAVHAEMLVVNEQLSALRGGLLRDLDGHLAPLTAEVLALRAQVEALLVQLAATPTPAASRPGQPRCRADGPLVDRPDHGSHPRGNAPGDRQSTVVAYD